MRLLHELAKIGATFDDPHLVSHAGLVPVMALAQRAGLADLAAEHVRIARPCGVNAPVKIACLAAGMAAGQTASMTWTCCVTVPCRCCSGISARRPRWGRSCGRSPGPSGTISSAAGSRRRDLGNGIHRLCLEQGQAITARLIVRRVKDLNRDAAQGQGELVTAWRYHAVFTDSPFTLAQAEEQHRGHAQAEQVFAGWTDGPLAHLPSVISPPTPPGSRSPPSAATCSAPPAPWPASPTATPAASRSAVT